MEEWVGRLWHRCITRSARQGWPEAAVELSAMARSAGIFFRALGGDGALQVQAAQASDHGARRPWLQRVAGVGEKVEWAWRDEQTLRLPARIEVFPQRRLNADLYLWLAAMAALENGHSRSADWFIDQQWRSRQLLQRFPGLRKRYERLTQAHLELRPNPETLSAEAAAQERAIRDALQRPGSVTALPPARHAPQPVWLWLHPHPPCAPAGVGAPNEGDSTPRAPSRRPADDRRRRAERVERPEGDRGLLFYRFDNLLTWGEYVKVDRCADDEDDLDRAEQALNDMDVLSIADSGPTQAARLRFDLDLPAPAYDDTPLGGTLLLPEWNYRQRCLRPAHCSVQPMVSARAAPRPLPSRLRPMAGRLRRQFEALAPARQWQRGCPEGEEIDLDAFTQYSARRLRGDADTDPGLYRALRRGKRDLACLVLADLSQSTDAHINDHQRVIEVIRDALYLFAEALTGTGDRFALYGFSSRLRQHVRINVLKAFGESYSDSVRGRLACIRPGYYTRMGAAIRYATRVLEREPAARRLLLLLTDGKPNDLDHYEGRYGAEDTRAAIREARAQGLQPFCVTVDTHAAGYLPHLFGSNGFVVIRQPAELPRRLPQLYAQLTA